MADVAHASLTDLRTKLRSSELRAVDLVEASLECIDTHNGRLHALITVCRDEARAQAAQVDASIREGRPVGPLAGLPITIKDAIPTKGIRTTGNSRLNRDWIPETEPLAVSRLRRAGAIILGKANCNEYLGIPSEDDLYGRPRNPFNPDYVGIGSSSGSGPAVVAGMGCASLATDSAGSVRLPAAQNGLVGLKASRGTIPRSETEAAPYLQVIGPLTRTVADTAALLDVLAPARLPTSSSRAHLEDGYEAHLEPRLESVKIGVPWHYIRTSPTEPEILDAFDRALDTLGAHGAEVVEVKPRGLAEGRMATFVVLYTEHHAVHAATLRSDFDKYGESARLYAMQGAFISAVDYLNALKLGRLLRHEIDEVLNEVDVLAMPTSPFVTAEAARKPSEHRQGMNTVFTGPFNLTGHPAITFTCGVSSLRIPMGMQLVGKHGAEQTLLNLGHGYQSVTSWHELVTGSDWAERHTGEDA